LYASTTWWERSLRWKLKTSPVAKCPNLMTSSVFRAFFSYICRKNRFENWSSIGWVAQVIWMFCGHFRNDLLFPANWKAILCNAFDRSFSYGCSCLSLGSRFSSKLCPIAAVSLASSLSLKHIRS
jgi:hypothetical protein